MRGLWTLVHRWVGLIIAGFLFVAGVTGAVISWDHELDEWLNPHLHDARAAGLPLSSFILARAIETRDPRARVTYFKLAPEEGHSLYFFVTGRIDPVTKRQYEMEYNQVYIDPATGEELGKRKYDQVWPITRETLVSF